VTSVILHVGDISTSGLDDHIAISGYPSMSHLFMNTFFEFGVVKNFVQRARVTAILSDLNDDLLLLPVLSVILEMYKYPCLYSCL